jgi:hypothetical protein
LAPFTVPNGLDRSGNAPESAEYACFRPVLVDGW